MRRIPILITFLVALCLAAPGAALAHHHHHARGHRHAKIERFSPPSPTAPATEPAGNAGTVLSFAGGILKLELANKSTAEGAVTNDTEISCEGAESTERTERPPEHDDMARAAWFGGGHDNEGDDEGDDDQGEEQEPPSSCGPASLVPGAAVHFAELRLGSSGSVFERIVLAG